MNLQSRLEKLERRLSQPGEDNSPIPVVWQYNSGNLWQLPDGDDLQPGQSRDYRIGLLGQEDIDSGRAVLVGHRKAPINDNA